jgi:hypothetical protein
MVDIYLNPLPYLLPLFKKTFHELTYIVFKYYFRSPNLKSKTSHGQLPIGLPASFFLLKTIKGIFFLFNNVYALKGNIGGSHQKFPQFFFSKIKEKDPLSLLF